jgi:hypothetical protein
VSLFRAAQASALISAFRVVFRAAVGVVGAEEIGVTNEKEHFIFEREFPFPLRFLQSPVESVKVDALLISHSFSPDERQRCCVVWSDL